VKTLGLAAGGLVGIALGALAVLKIGPFAPPPPRPVTLERLTTTGAARSPAVSPDGSVVAYFANRCPNRPLECPWDLVWQDVAGGPPLKLIEGLADERLAIASAGLVWSSHYPLLRWLDQAILLAPGASVWTTTVIPRTGGTQRVLPGVLLGVGAGDTIYTTPDERNVLEVAARSGEVADTIANFGRPTLVEGSPDGRWLAVVLPSADAYDRSAVLLVTDRRGVVRDTVARDLYLRGEVRWSAASNAVYYWRLGATLTEGRLVRRQISRKSGRGRGAEALVVDRSGLSYAPSFDISREGRRLALEATATQDDYTVLYLAADGRIEGRPRVLRTLSRYVFFNLTPDGRKAIFWEPQGVGKTLTFRVHVSPIDSLALRPVGPDFPSAATLWMGYDSRHVTVHHQAGGRLEWTTVDLETGSTPGWREIPHADGSLVTVAGGLVWVSGDGRSLSFFDPSGTETAIREWPTLGTTSFTVLAVAPDGRSVGIEAYPDSGRRSDEANLPVELFVLSISDLSIRRVAYAPSTPWNQDWGPRWIREAPAVMTSARSPRGAGFWVPDARAGIRKWAELPPGFDWAPISADGRVVLSAVTRWTSDILIASLQQPD
jgi:hypothetical protein